MRYLTCLVENTYIIGCVILPAGSMALGGGGEEICQGAIGSTWLVSYRHRGQRENLAHSSRDASCPLQTYIMIQHVQKRCFVSAPNLHHDTAHTEEMLRVRFVSAPNLHHDTAHTEEMLRVCSKPTS